MFHKYLYSRLIKIYLYNLILRTYLQIQNFLPNLKGHLYFLYFMPLKLPKTRLPEFKAQGQMHQILMYFLNNLFRNLLLYFPSLNKPLPTHSHYR
jgi:hypothetical protein